MEHLNLHDERAKITDAIATLKGPQNWRRWEQDFKIHIEAYSESNWRMITGEWARPATPTEAEAETQRDEFQQQSDEMAAAFRLIDVAAGRVSLSTTPVTPVMEASVRITTEMVHDRRKAEQVTWDKINKRCISWIHSKITPRMRVYVRSEMTAYEVYTALRKVCVSTSHQSKCDKLKQWLNYMYKGSKPMEFVAKWQ